MRPILLHLTLPGLGGVVVPAYVTLLTVGFGMAAILTVRSARQWGLSPRDVLALNLYMALFGLIGSRLLSVLADGQLHEYINLCLDPLQVPARHALAAVCDTAVECGRGYLCDPASHTCHPPRDCLAWAKVWQGGMAYYGGFVMASGYCIYWCRRHGISPWRIGDLAAPGIMQGLFFGRLGCFLNGCCYGKRTDSALGVRFPRGSAPWRVQLDAHLIGSTEQMHPLHPAQLYEAAGCLLIAAFLYFVAWPRRRADGQVYGLMLVLYGVLRSLCEVLRDDDRGVLFGWLSTSQIVSAPLIAAGLYLLLRRPAGTALSG